VIGAIWRCDIRGGDGDLVDKHHDYHRKPLTRRWLSGITRRNDIRSSTVLLVSLAMLIGTFLFAGVLVNGHESEPAQGELVLEVMGTGTPPNFVQEPKDPTKTNAYTKVSFTAIVIDGDDDILSVTWEWGDGTPNDTTVTDPAGINTVITNSHYYNLTIQQGRGGYIEYLTMNVTLDDGNGNLVTAPTTVQVTMPSNSAPQIIDLSGPSGRVESTNVVLISANASDAEGEPLTWTFEFNNSVEVYDVVVNNTAATAPGEVVWVYFNVSFATPGSYTITLNLTDALRPYQVWPHNVSESMTIEVVGNSIPNVLSTINVDPDSPSVQSRVGYVMVNYSIQADDPDGDVLTLTWNFDDGSPEVVNTSAGGTGTVVYVQVRNYTEPGEFNITVLVTDGRPGHEILVYKNVTVSSNNRPPNMASFDYSLSGGAKARANETLNFTMVIRDVDLDAIEVVIDFGDNSSRLYLNLTEFVDDNLTYTFSHIYTKVGNYTITIWYTDNKIGLFEHNKEYTTLITIEEPLIVEVLVWDWWDYFTLSLVALAPVLVVLRFAVISRRRKSLEAEGMTLEEYKLVTSELAGDVKGKK
jgi:hypothetical protein